MRMEFDFMALPGTLGALADSTDAAAVRLAASLAERVLF